MPAETALAHPGLIGKDRKRKIARQMLVDPVMQRAELVVGCLQSQGRAELRLSTGTLEEYDQVAGHGERYGTAPRSSSQLRHACGYKLAKDGVDTRSLQAYLGHRNIQNTTRYTALAPDRFKGFWRD